MCMCVCMYVFYYFVYVAMYCIVLFLCSCREERHLLTTGYKSNQIITPKICMHACMHGDCTSSNDFVL